MNKYEIAANGMRDIFRKQSFKFLWAVAAGIFLMAGFMQNAHSAVTYHALPFKAEDLKAGERVSTGDHASGIQGEGEDFGVKRYLGNKKWSHVKNGTDGKKNTDYLIYGKPVYAIGDGTIVGCWRNAPENPRPGERHAKKDRIPGGGNMLWVDHADGTRVLYAHMIPGSIYEKLCANNAQLFPKPKSDANPEGNYVMLPAGKTVKIKKGQFLGKAGNSGSSSGPHLHLHMQKAGKAAKMFFERGLYKSSVNADLNGWKNFAKKEIPDGKILIWPPRTVFNEYTRFGYKDDDFQRLFDHLVDSGYELEWIDGYSVNNQGYLNFSWKPASGKKWKAYFGQTGAQYQKRYDTNKNLAPIFVDSYTIGGKVRYNVILKAVPGNYMARHGLTYDQHMQVMKEAKKRKLEPVNVSVASVGNNLSYTVLYRNRNYGAWNIKSRIKEGDYQKVFNDFKKAGKTPVYLNAYKHKGTTYFSAIFAKNGGGSLKARHGMSASVLQKEWKNAVDKGFNTMILTAFDGAASKHRFAGLWRK
ncbi:Peptidase family M23 [Nitrosomonas sp. Nm51]|uniref:M23 family metallopeptidase n=1 Tax=Nitrosomonas sp. Nm51 TaxID=133720 RepID=UPI0008C167CE|nr:M23 family metallopeptidase [Nitrosomonas sp. Nm51]SEQ78803.1 Peptidase family M23 [Nitrosomonas sp. Nm51]